MRILVIGAGSIGRRHHANLGTLGAEAVLVPFRAFAGEQTLDEVTPDAVVIATATQVRTSPIALCAARGLPFYCEKPLAYDAGELATIEAAAAPVADRSMLGFMMRYHPAFRDLAQRDLSDIYRFSFEIGHDVRQWRANWSFAASYAAKPAGGGVLLDLCHELDMAATLFPEAALGAVTSLGHASFPGVDFATRINLGAGGTVAMDYLSPVSLRRIALRGTGQCHDLDLIAGRMVSDTGKAPQTRDIVFDRNTMFLDAMRDFLALVEGRQTSDVEHLPRFDLALPACRLIAAAWQVRQFAGEVEGDYP
ncbi:MAG: hypothetical protein GC146_08750 [Limimaricola sp.]|uniref:Gfo/Idh/MocA family protein n=1 Tax=Limimaricola sp. TaxID=2211665 RepID=UPI001DCF367E|nr:hypothetical protein [Limimaricola sp.]MBI1417296.1 hypothetical protein [Limimaricola sp.]